MREKVDPNKLTHAKSMYMNFQSVPEIAIETGINPRTIRYYVDNFWNKERSAESAKFFEYIADNKKVQLVNITDRALTIIENCMRDLAAKPVVKISEARQVADILEKIDRILKLDEGKATNISSVAAPSSVIELKKRLKIDPFVNLGDDLEKTSDSIITISNS